MAPVAEHLITSSAKQAQSISIIFANVVYIFTNDFDVAGFVPDRPNVLPPFRYQWDHD